jgi:hypothetical protein
MKNTNLAILLGATMLAAGSAGALEGRMLPEAKTGSPKSSDSERAGAKETLPGLSDIIGEFYRQDGKCVEKYTQGGTTYINSFVCPEKATLADSDLMADTVCKTNKVDVACKDANNMGGIEFLQFQKRYLDMRIAYQNHNK